MSERWKLFVDGEQLPELLWLFWWLAWRWLGLPGKEDVGVENGDEHTSSLDFFEFIWMSSGVIPSLEGLQGEATTRPLRLAALKETPPLWWHWAMFKLSFRCRREFQVLLSLAVGWWTWGGDRTDTSPTSGIWQLWWLSSLLLMLVLTRPSRASLMAFTSSKVDASEDDDDTVLILARRAGLTHDDFSMWITITTRLHWSLTPANVRKKWSHWHYNWKHIVNDLH